MVNDLEFNKPFLDGLNNDIKKLISKTDNNELLDCKLYEAEFVIGCYKGTCNRCFKDLSNEYAIMVSKTRNFDGNIYRVCNCRECATEILKEFVEDH